MGVRGRKVAVVASETWPMKTVFQLILTMSLMKIAMKMRLTLVIRELAQLMALIRNR